MSMPINIIVSLIAIVASSATSSTASSSQSASQSSGTTAEAGQKLSQFGTTSPAQINSN